MEHVPVDGQGRFVMEAMIIILGLLVVLLLLDIAAWRWGVDSTDVEAGARTRR